MEPERTGGTQQAGGASRWLMGWQASFLLGLITVVLGLIVSFHPVTSLVVVVVLLGIGLIASGIFHLARALDGAEQDRVWRAIAGVVCVVTGVVLIRHLHLSLALAGLIIGFTWIVQGVSALFEGISGRRRTEAGWLVFFGVISLIAGIVVMSVPISSVTALAVLMGIWFIVLGVLEMLGALVLRRIAIRQRSGQIGVPGQRAAEAASSDAPPAGRPAAG
jgi:uncharacterized membrane protein HdeD (DUF308 family)